MSKKEARKLKAGFFMAGGILSVIHLHSKWSFGWVWSLILGFVFIITLGLGMIWVIKKALW